MSSSVIGGVVAVIIAVLVVGIASRRQKHTKDDASK
jgi:ethanolamine transporter EutH|tara:strand:- start:185 stop:292 length:108 start_codon:yes stop_codon:yes gene_type:complete